MLLAHHTETARRAHYWSSFNPDRAGERVISEHSAELQADIEFLEKSGAEAEAVTSYRNRYERFFVEWLHKKGRTASAAVTGPARFPTDRNRKALRSEHVHFEVFQTWREKAKRAIIRKMQPVKTFSSEADRYRKEIENKKKAHEIMKQVNAIIRKAKGNDCTAEIMAAGLSEKNAIEIQKPDFCGRIGFAQFNLTNNLANIKRLEERLKEMETKEANAATIGAQDLNFEGGRVVINHEADRVQIFYDAKPTPEKITELKRNGFKWAPSCKAWQRQNTINGQRAVKTVTGITL